MAQCGPQGGLPIQINAFITPSSIWATEIAQRGMSDERHQLYILEQRLSSLLKDDRRKHSSQLRKEGELIAIRNLHDSRKWHRGRIESALQLPTGYKYSVVLIDHGDILRAKGDHIRDLPLDFHSLSPQAMKLVLEGIVPITLQISLEKSSSTHETSLTWKPAADRFVEDILRNYKSAFFVERSRKGQIRIGDILLTMPDQDLVSLSKLLCENNYAVHSMDKFCDRQLICSEDFNEPQLCPSPPAIASSSGTSSSCAPSPANAMLPSLSSGSEASGRQMSFSEYYEMKKKNSKKSETTTSLKESSMSASDTDNDKKPSKLDLLRSLKKGSVIRDYGTSGEKTNKVNSSETLEDNSMPIPKALDSAYVPAGRSIIKTVPKKVVGSWSKAEKKPYGHNSLSEDDNFTFSEKPQHHTRRTRTSGSSDSSDAQSQRTLKNHTSMQRTHNAPDAGQSSNPQSQQIDDHFSSETSLTSGSRQKLPPWLSRRNNSTLDNLKESCNGLKEGQGTTSPSYQSNPHSSVAQDNELRSKACTPLSTKSHKLSDYDIDAEEFLARAVLVHGGFAPSPWWTHSEVRSKFSAHIEQCLINMNWMYSILTLQKYMWPAIQKRQNVVMVSPPKSGKSSSYIIPLMDFMIDSEQKPRCNGPLNGPLVIILCAGSKSVDNTFKDCLRLVNGIENGPRVEKASGLGLNIRDLLKLLNGCEVFITTPPCLLRILEDHKNSYALNFKRLCHYVLDQADVLITKFLHEMEEIQLKVVAEQVLRTKSEARPIQVIMASEKWEPRFLSFSSQVLGNPLLVINDCYEACVYGKPEVKFHLTKKNNKLTKLVEIVRDIEGLHKTVVFCNQCEVAELKAFLGNACMKILVPSAGASITEFEVIRNRWDTTNAGHHYIMICTDADFDCFRRRDATCLVHYSLPMQDRTFFAKRLASILDNLPDISEQKTTSKLPEIHLLMDETNSDQLPVITKLMQRISDKVQLDTKLLEAAQAASKMKEIKTKTNKLFCKDLKMFGQCLKTNCPNRHVFMPELDESSTLPRSGWVTLEVVHVHSAAHFSARLIEHIAEDGSRVPCPSKYFKLCALLAKHFNHIKNPSNQELKTNVSIGDIFAVETVENLYHRVQVLEILEKDMRGNPQLVLVQFLDEGKQQSFQVFALHKLPEALHLKDFPAQVIDVFLCGLLPADQDDDYAIDGKHCVQKWMKKSGDQESERNTHLQGKIVLSMTGTLLVDSVHIMEWLPHMKTNVKRMNIKEKLLAGNYALENPDHISKLFKLCGKDESALVPEVLKIPSIKKSLVKPEWAFLERDMFEDIHFICAEDLENISVFFVQKMKFQSLLETLTKDVNQAPPKQNQDNVCFEGGDFCLALYEEKWYRAKILSKNEELFTVFYVDYGNTRDVSVNELQCIPDWAITRLPFQAIECSLAGVSSCDVASKIRDLTDDGSKTLYAKVAEHKNAIVTEGKHFVVAVVHVDFSKPETSIINKDLLALNGVKPFQKEMRYLDFDVDISMFHQESLSEDESGESGEQTVNQYEDLNVSDLEFKDEYSSAASDDERFFEDILKADPKFIETIREAVSHGKSPVTQGTAQPLTITGDNATGDSISTQQHSERKVVTEQGQNLSDDDDWEEDGDFIGRYKLPLLGPARPPRTKWVEDLYYVWLKICLSEVDSYYLEWTHNSIHFGATVGGRIFYLNQQLRGIIWPNSVKPCFKGFTIELKMKKACSGIFWERPFAAQRRFAWLSRDLEAMADASSDSDCGFSLEAINKEIRKIPVKLRRRKTEKGRTLKPDLASDSGGSKSDNEMDSDEMF